MNRIDIYQPRHVTFHSASHSIVLECLFIASLAAKLAASEGKKESGSGVAIVHVTTGFGGYKKESQVSVLVASEPLSGHLGYLNVTNDACSCPAIGVVSLIPIHAVRTGQT